MKKFDTYQTVIIVLSVAIIIALAYFSYSVFRGNLGRAAITVETAYSKSKVLINGKDRGETPVYDPTIFAGNIDVTINGKDRSYTTSISPSVSTEAVIERDLGVSDTFSSGQNVWFEKVSSDESFISVVSPNTEEISVIVDGVEQGKAPLKFSTKNILNQNENGKYKIEFSKKGYEKQEIIINAKKGYTINIRIDMFLNPIPENVNVLEGFPEGVQFIDFSNISSKGYENRADWAKAVNYWLTTRGEATFGNSKVSKFVYFITDQGKLYDETGIEANKDVFKAEKDTFIAYLGENNSGKISDEAKSLIEELTGKKVETSGADSKDEKVFIKIKPTGLAFLRVRKDASKTSEEVAKVDVGKQYPFVEEKSGWYKIEYETGKQGWVSSVYGEKVEGASTKSTEEEKKTDASATKTDATKDTTTGTKTEN